jgi:hypothetical protein
MNPLIVSAQHAAYAWYLNNPTSPGKDFEDARRFARTRWTTFLPVANEGWGRLLLRVANGRQSKGARHQRLMKQGA